MTTRRNRRVLMFREAFPTRPGSSRIVRLCACAVEKSIWPPCVGADAWMSRRRRICTEGRSSAWRKGVPIDVPGSREIKSWAYLAERRRSRTWSVPRPDMCVARSENRNRPIALYRSSKCLIYKPKSGFLKLPSAKRQETLPARAFCS